jgi:hypothetical protein
MKFTQMLPALALIAGLSAGLAAAQETTSWRYYRPSNTGIQGDYNEAIWVGPDGDPYIGGYEPTFEEGGFAKFVQAENRWINYSNVDYPVIGHPDLTGCVRVSDIVADDAGKLWLATGRGALRFDPAVGGSSIINYGPHNSQLPGGWTSDVDIAPGGALWFASISVSWGGGGITRYQPSTGTWTHWATGDRHLSVQPKPGGGYYVWSADSYYGYVFRFDSATQVWTTLPFPPAPGDIAGMPGKDCVDDAGNFWALRLVPDGGWETLDYRQPDGTWVAPAPPYPSVTFDIWAFRAFGNAQALLANGNGDIWRFNGTSWQSLGQWRPGGYTEDVNIDGAGNVWACGTEGAAKRDATTGVWQRYRITNTSQIDYFVRDLSLGQNGAVWVTGNAGPGVGGMERFDGTRWSGWNDFTYGLGAAWPFPTDNADAIAYRPSNGHIAVNPTFNGVREWTGSTFLTLDASSTSKGLVEDSLGRLWSLGEYFSLNYYDGNGWTNMPIVGSGSKIQKDPTRPGTVWAATDYEIQRTDGNYSFSRSISNFPGAATWFTGLAADANGIAWIGTWTQFTSTGSTLIRLDANTGLYQMFQHDQGWPFPGEHVRPLAITPDGRLWMQYDSEYPSNDAGLCWYDGVNVGTFPAPPGGEPQWGGLPHSAIGSLEVRVIPGGYELWMSCASRGIAVLAVQTQTTAVDPGEAPAVRLTLAQNQPNPFRARTQIHFGLPRTGSARLDIFDVTGRLVRRLVDGTLMAGDHAVEWDGRTDAMGSMPSGVYLYRLEAGGEVIERRMLLLH